MNSRFNYFNFAPLTSDGGALDIHRHTAKNLRFNLDAYQTITLTAADAHNLPGIAEKHLGDMNLWWLLLEFNALSDPIEDVRPGLRLRIPSRSAVIRYLETTNNPNVTVTI